MNRNEDAEKVEKQLNSQIRQAKHSPRYYLSIAILVVVVPAYVLTKFFDASATTWRLFDLFIIVGLLAVAIYGLYNERAPGTKVPLLFSVIGVISVIIVTLLNTFLR